MMHEADPRGHQAEESEARLPSLLEAGSEEASGNKPVTIKLQGELVVIMAVAHIS